jgi:diguanylate cyclase (GGDEF)-like protein
MAPVSNRNSIVDGLLKYISPNQFTLIVAGLMVCIAGIVGFCNYLVWTSQDVRANSKYESYQLASEIMRAQLAVADAFIPGSKTTKSDIEIRFQIIQNRFQVIEGGAVLEALKIVPDGITEYNQIKSEILRVSAHLVDVTSPEVGRLVLNRLAPINARILGLVASSQLVMTQRLNVFNNIRDTAIVVFSLIVVGLMCLGLLLANFVFRLGREVQYDSIHDPLTGALNRKGLGKTMHGRCDKNAFSIVVMDIDEFKAINDRHGYEVGDKFLINFASDVKKYLDELALFARLGSDEYCVVFLGEDAKEKSILFSDQMLAHMGAPFNIDDSCIMTTVCIGVLNKEKSDKGEFWDFMRCADLALYSAKQTGRSSCRIFDPKLRAKFQREQELKQGLLEALRLKELSLNFQPLVEVSGEKIVGYEALLRWHHGHLGQISPAEFIPIAEGGFQIIPIGRWVIEQALQAAMLWPDTVFVSINLSVRQFSDASLLDFIRKNLLRLDCPPQRVVFEITESVLALSEAAKSIRGLRELGCKVALDDFGTGYASLSYLWRFDFDKIKLDKAFIQTGSENQKNLIIAHSICKLAKNLKLKIVAEGIESKDQLRFIESLGCEYAQGYLFGRPKAEII